MTLKLLENFLPYFISLILLDAFLLFCVIIIISAIRHILILCVDKSHAI